MAYLRRSRSFLGDDLWNDVGSEGHLEGCVWRRRTPYVRFSGFYLRLKDGCLRLCSEGLGLGPRGGALRDDVMNGRLLCRVARFDIGRLPEAVLR